MTTVALLKALVELQKAITFFQGDDYRLDSQTMRIHGLIAQPSAAEIKAAFESAGPDGKMGLIHALFNPIYVPSGCGVRGGVAASYRAVVVLA